MNNIHKHSSVRVRSKSADYIRPRSCSLCQSNISPTNTRDSPKRESKHFPPPVKRKETRNIRKNTRMTEFNKKKGKEREHELILEIHRWQDITFSYHQKYIEQSERVNNFPENDLTREWLHEFGQKYTEIFDEYVRVYESYKEASSTYGFPINAISPYKDWHKQIQRVDIILKEATYHQLNDDEVRYEMSNFGETIKIKLESLKDSTELIISRSMLNQSSKLV